MRENIALELYRVMLKIRFFEEKVCSLYPRQEIKTPVHLSIGQEAISTGLCSVLKKHDRVFGTHRGHGLYIAKGGNIRKLAAELYGKKNGCSGGKGGSMHIVDHKKGVFGTSSIVGGNIPLAVGSALNSRISGDGAVSCAVFGDGAVDEGVFFESLNFASLKKLPVIFVCENNFYAVHSHVSARQPHDNIFQRGGCFGVESVRVDGNDAERVREVSLKAVKRARSGTGPSLLECRTYRFKTHVGPESDAELDFPPKKYLAEWLKKDPLRFLRGKLVAEKVLSAAEDKKIKSSLSSEIEDAFLYAKRCVSASPQDLLSDVVAGNSR
jgi:acetoin:2,6-dichlorophenolindophenol oxidoreductase subunit alpha